MLRISHGDAVRIRNRCGLKKIRREKNERRKSERQTGVCRAKASQRGSSMEDKKKTYRRTTLDDDEERSARKNGVGRAR